MAGSRSPTSASPASPTRFRLPLPVRLWARFSTCHPSRPAGILLLPPPTSTRSESLHTRLWPAVARSPASRRSPLRWPKSTTRRQNFRSPSLSRYATSSTAASRRLRQSARRRPHIWRVRRKPSAAVMSPEPLLPCRASAEQGRCLDLQPEPVQPRQPALCPQPVAARPGL